MKLPFLAMNLLGVTCLILIWSSTCGGQLHRQTIYGQMAPWPAAPPPPVVLRQPLLPPPLPLPMPPRRPYPLHEYSPLRKIDIYHSNYNRMSENGGPPAYPIQANDDSWIAAAIDGYNVQTTPPPTTTDAPTTTDQPDTTTTAYQKYPKFYYDDYMDLITVQPANAIVIALINLVAVIMIFLGSGVAWVGRRSIDGGGDGDHRHDAEMYGLTLLNDGLMLGSSETTSDQCLQRAACEVPRKAELYAQGFDTVIWLKRIFTSFVPDTVEHMTQVGQELRRAASMANDGIDCKWNFPCKSLSYLVDDDTG